MEEVKIGTRGSKLALWQAEFVASELSKNGLKPIISVIETKGDQLLDVSISKIGGKGVFTEELEEQLKNGTIDIAVHSAKDLPSRLPEELKILAFTEREKANDVLISSNHEISLETDPITVGTSSTRRIATLRHYYPHVKTVEIRGNLQTRIRKMEEGQCDALLLAFAGVYRMGYSHMIVQELSLEKFTPAVGQGSLALEVSTEMDPVLATKIYEAINHNPTEKQLLAERAYLRELEGGCSIPAFALAQYSESGNITLQAGIFSLDGKKLKQKSSEFKADQCMEGGQKLAKEILKEGGQEILKEIRKQL